MPKRILIVGEFGTRNGGENSILAVIPSLIRRGWEFHAAVPIHSDFADALQQSGICVNDLSMNEPSGARKSQTVIRADVTKFINLTNPDIIHCNSLSTSRICGPIASQLKLPSLGYLRDIMKLSKQAMADINELDRIIAVSKATRDWHCCRGIDLEKTFVVYNGVDTETFFPSATFEQSNARCPIRHELGISTDAPVLLFVGQIGIRKGVDTLVGAFQIAARSLPNAHLLIVGQRHSQKQEAIEFENRLHVQTDSSTYRPKIHWLGARSDVADLMRASTILVHPARQEPLGRVLLEAMASGLPIITTRVGGSAEILSTPELDSMLVDPNDTSGLADAIIGLANDAAKRKQLSRSIRAIAENAFSIDQCEQQLNLHYRRLLHL